MLENLGRPARVLLLGGTSEIGLAILSALRLPQDTRIVLAGRDEQRLVAAGKELPYQSAPLLFDALATGIHAELIGQLFDEGPLDLVLAATGLLTPQPQLDADPVLAARMIDTNFTGHVTALLAVAGRMRAQGTGLIVVLSSIAAIRPRKANYVYGAAKAGLDAFARGLADALTGSGVRVLVVRPGFVIGKMTAGMSPAPLSSTPEQVGEAVATALEGKASELWVPRGLALFALVLRLIPRPLWRKMRR
jgi:decaprenylphospho-beta-D-erythro-pentofuranosid-2-ulose 2-reductase